MAAPLVVQIAKQGPAGPVNTLTVGTVTTGNPGTSASVTLTGDSPTQVLNMTIPRGDFGAATLTSPSLFVTAIGSNLLYAPAGDFDADALTYIQACGLTGDAAFVIDDIVRMLKGQTSASSLRGSAWTVLSANRWTTLEAFHVLAAAYNVGSGTSVKDLAGNHDLTLATGMLWGADGFRFNGTTHKLTAAAAAITSGQWSCLAVGTSDTASVGQTFAGQGEFPTDFRVGFTGSNASGYLQIFKKVEPTSYSAASTTLATARHSVLGVQTATDLEVYVDGSETAAATTALAATTIANAAYTVGGGPSYFDGEIQLVALWSEDVSADNAELHANLNALLGLGL